MVDFLNTEAGALLRPQLRRLAAEDSAGLHRSMRIVLIIGGVVTLVGAGILLTLLVGFVTLAYSWPWSLTAVIALLLTLYAYFIIREVGDGVSIRNPVFRWMLMIWLAGITASTILLGPEAVFLAWLERPLGIFEQLASGFMFMLLLTIATVAVVAGLEKAVDLTMDRIMVRRRPVSTALFELLWAAYLLQRARNGILWPNWKWNIVDALRCAARAIEIGIPRLVPIDDLSTRAAVRRRLANASHAINRLSHDIMLGNQEARLDVLAKLERATEAILTQSYDELPDLSEEQEVERQQELLRAIRRRFGRIVWQVFVALLPLAVVSAVRLSPLDVPPEALDALTTLAVGWLVIKLLGAIDPGYKESLAGAQAMANEIRGGGPK